DLPAFGRSASERIHGRECAELLYRTIHELVESRREVILMTLQGDKVRDIVRATGKSAAAVSGLKFNAMKEPRENREANCPAREARVGGATVRGTEQRALDEHLAVCPPCTEDLADLAALVVPPRVALAVRFARGLVELVENALGEILAPPEPALARGGSAG